MIEHAKLARTGGLRQDLDQRDGRTQAQPAGLSTRQLTLGGKRRIGGSPTVPTQGSGGSCAGISVVLAVQRTSWAPHASLEVAAATAATSGASVFRRPVGLVALVRGHNEREATGAASALAQGITGTVRGVVVGMSAPARQGLDSANQEADEAVALAHCCPRVPTTLADCPAERALSRDPVALVHASERVDALASNPAFIATLEAYFLHDGDRRTTANALAIQIRTLDYRLRRAEELTGLSARRAHDSRLMVAGLTGRRVLRRLRQLSPR